MSLSGFTTGIKSGITAYIRGRNPTFDRTFSYIKGNIFRRFLMDKTVPSTKKLMIIIGNTFVSTIDR